ncbi:MAG: SAM-dependent methyltransferase [Candidatus Omnitrophota bacterium]
MAQKLFLIPNFLHETSGSDVMPGYIKEMIKHVRAFLAEDQKSAQRFLRKIDSAFPLTECQFFSLNEHTKKNEAEEYLNMCFGQDIGIISECGMPCVADPGADIVLLAHQKDMEIIPLIGPSSIFLALCASGLNGQNFSFNGYLPKERDERLKKIKFLEQRSNQEGQTQIFMETPYRNEHLFEDILSSCRETTWLCVACDLTSPTQMVKTLSIKNWKKEKPSLNKRPAIFLIQTLSPNP